MYAPIGLPAHAYGTPRSERKVSDGMLGDLFGCGIVRTSWHVWYDVIIALNVLATITTSGVRLIIIPHTHKNHCLGCPRTPSLGVASGLTGVTLAIGLCRASKNPAHGAGMESALQCGSPVPLS